MDDLKKTMANSKARFALIDADSILYAIALSSELKSPGTGHGGEDEFFQVKDGEECYREVVRRLEAMVQEVGAEDALICLTPPGKSFRYHLLDSYKANRATFRRPGILVALQALVAQRKPFRTLAVRGLEADDVCGITQGVLQNANMREPVIVSIDKDMLQIPGLNYSWLSAARNGTVGQLNEVSEFDGDRMHLYQTLCGDAVDNYTGCPGIGPKKADKILDNCVNSQGVLDWAFVEKAFLDKGLSKEYALTQARVARILRHTDWDPKRKEVTLWKPPQEFAASSPEVRQQRGASANKAPPSRQSSPTCEGILGVPSKVILSEREGATLH